MHLVSNWYARREARLSLLEGTVKGLNYCLENVGAHQFLGCSSSSGQVVVVSHFPPMILWCAIF